MTITSLGPVKLGSWLVQGSILNNDSICLFFRDINTGSVIIKFFMDEEDALAYLRYVTMTDTSAL